MGKADRSLALYVRVSIEEKSMLGQLATSAGLSDADIVRQLIRAEYKRNNNQLNQEKA